MHALFSTHGISLEYFEAMLLVNKVNALLNVGVFGIVGPTLTLDSCFP